MSFIEALRPVTFEYRRNEEIPPELRVDDPVERPTTAQHGFIAQDVKAAIEAHPEIADGFDMWSETDYGRQLVSPTAIIPILVTAIQELSAELKEIKEKL